MFSKALLTILFIIWAVPLFAQSVDTAWVRRYNGNGPGSCIAYAIAVDDSENVYVTGGSYEAETNWDYTTIKYYPNGDTAWVRIYNGPANADDQAYALALDAAGSAYVTGNSATVKYGPHGSQLWVGKWGGADIALDDSGNVYVAGGSADYITAKYYADGDTAWLRTYNGPGDSRDWANGIAVDSSCNVYVTGSSLGSGSDLDYATIKYYPNGDTGWVRRYSGPGELIDIASAIVADQAGNIYVTGYSRSTVKKYDYVTIKYDRVGNELWVRSYDGPDRAHDYAYAITTDEAANVYVTGRCQGHGTARDYGTVKYDPSGNQLWAKTYAGPSNDADEAEAIGVDASGNVYVTGFSISESKRDYATVKYDPSGNEIWVERYDGPTHYEDWAFGMAIDECGCVYVTGYSMGFNWSYDYLTIKYVQFLRADVDKNGEVNLADVVYLVNYLFKPAPAPVPAPIVGDATCDSNVDINDVIYLINYLFRGGPAPSI